MTTIANLNGDQKRILEAWIRREAVLKSVIRQAGLIATNNEYNKRAAGAGNKTQIQFFNPLTGDSEVGNDDLADKITPGALSAGMLDVTRLFRAKAWAAAELASVVSGLDAMAAIAGGVGEWRALDDQKVALALLAGIAKNALANDAATMTKDAAGKLDNKVLIGAAQTKGELKGSLSTLVVHSAVQAQLAMDNLIVNVPASEQSPAFETYAGKRLVISDAMPVDEEGVYTSLLCAQGIIGYGEATPDNGEVETVYDAAAGNGMGGETLITRRQFIMGGYGYSFAGAANPDNTVLETAASYTRKYAAKQIPLVFINSTVEF